MLQIAACKEKLSPLHHNLCAHIKLTELLRPVLLAVDLCQIQVTQHVCKQVWLIT